MGRHVKTLIDGLSGPVESSVGWNGTNEQGIKVSSGVYIIRLRSHVYSAAVKTVFLK